VGFEEDLGVEGDPVAIVEVERCGGGGDADGGWGAVFGPKEDGEALGGDGGDGGFEEWEDCS